MLRRVATLVLLLRAINLGSKHKVPMAELRAVLEEAGFEEVRTLLNSGNVVLRAGEPVAKAQAHAERVLWERFGFEIPVMARTAAQIAKVVETADDCDHVVFFPGKPPAAAVKKAQAAELGNDRLVAAGKELYLWLPDGVQHSKLLKALGTSDGTMRTLGTVRKLHQLASGA
jgi:uncharacterized protein (DUF1697 family)